MAQEKSGDKMLSSVDVKNALNIRIMLSKFSDFDCQYTWIVRMLV